MVFSDMVDRSQVHGPGHGHHGGLKRTARRFPCDRTQWDRRHARLAQIPPQADQLLRHHAFLHHQPDPIHRTGYEVIRQTLVNELPAHHVQSDDGVGPEFMELVDLKPIRPVTPVDLRIRIPTASLDVAQVGPGTGGLIGEEEPAGVAHGPGHLLHGALTGFVTLKDAPTVIQHARVSRRKGPVHIEGYTLFLQLSVFVGHLRKVVVPARGHTTPAGAQAQAELRMVLYRIGMQIVATTLVVE